MERPPSTPGLVLLSGSLPLLWMRPDLSPSPAHSVSACNVLFLSIGAWFAVKHTHSPLILAHMPASHSPYTPTNTHTHTHELSPPDVQVYPAAHCCLMWADDITDKTKMPPAPSAAEGQPFILYYVAVMRRDRGPPNCWVRGTEGPKTGQEEAGGWSFHWCLRIDTAAL